MLNEKQEYELYLTPGYGGLFRDDNLLDDLSGIKHIFEILARGMLEKCEVAGVTSLERQTQYCVDFLKVWMVGGFEPQGELAQYPYVCDDFRKAGKCNLKRHLLSLGKRENSRQEKYCRLFKKKTVTGKTDREKLNTYLNNRIKLYDNSMFYFRHGHSQNQIHFRAIVADAIHKGPLTDTVLVVRNTHPNFGVKGNLDPARLNVILAITGVYLQNRFDGQVSVPLNFAQLSNLVKKPASSRGEKKTFGSVADFIGKAGFTYNGKPLFVKTEITEAGKKIRINADWLRDMDVHLIDADAPIPAEAYARFTDAMLSK